MAMEWSTIVNITMYIIIFAFAVREIIIENMDWKCVMGDGTTTEKCDWTAGMPYRGSKAEPGDDTSALLDRIDIASKADSMTIKWRRAVFTSVIILAVVFFFIAGGLPKWTVFYAGTIVSTALLYFIGNFYSYHYYAVPEKIIQENTKMIRQQLEIM